MNKSLIATLIVCLFAGHPQLYGGDTPDTVEPIAPSMALFLPNEEGSVKFAVIGDSGTGGRAQHDVAARMAEYHDLFPFSTVLMLGDNIYGIESSGNFERKFERPYAPLLGAGVQFFAVLGNHDTYEQLDYGPFNMNGRRYYTFVKGNTQFFALDSTLMSELQLSWLESELSRSKAKWKICFLHHPLYSSGKTHGPDLELRGLLEPVMAEYGVHAVFAGHDHIYERSVPQKGITHFVSGASAKLRKGNVRITFETAHFNDREQHFILLEATDDGIHYQVVSRSGALIDWGAVR